MINLNEVWGRAEVKLITPRSAIRLARDCATRPNETSISSKYLPAQLPQIHEYFLSSCNNGVNMSGSCMGTSHIICGTRHTLTLADEVEIHQEYYPLKQ